MGKDSKIKHRVEGLTKEQAIQSLRARGLSQNAAEECIGLDLYDNLIIPFLPSYPIVGITYAIKMNGSTFFSIYAVDSLTLETINDLLEPLKPNVVKDVIDSLNNIFNELENLLDDRQKPLFLSHERLDVIHITRRYIADYHKNFPNANSFLLKDEVRDYIHYHDERFKKESNDGKYTKPKELLKSIKKGKSILELLRSGADPNLIVDVLYAALPMLDECEDREKDEILSNIRSLLNYGVNVHAPDPDSFVLHAPFYGSNSALAAIISRIDGREIQNPKMFALSKEIIKMLTFFDKRKSLFYVPARCSQKNSIAFYAINSRWAFELSGLIPKSIPLKKTNTKFSMRTKMRSKTSQNINFFYKHQEPEKLVKNPYKITEYEMLNNKKATVESWRFLDLIPNTNVMVELYDIFKRL